MKAEAEFSPDECTVIDGKNAVLGRLASTVASRLLDGERVAVVNAEEIVVSGDTDDTVERYRKKTSARSDQGPDHPKRPDGLARRTVRGMVPHKKKRGREAMSNLRFYIDVPREYAGDDVEFETVEDADAENLGKARVIRLGEISKKLGANVTW
ncbi:MAG: 50S ribosomal protein L13 [Halobacteria archaeon]|nr:50S ribosomal protein L13 [Halobacteria archaeon]